MPKHSADGNASALNQLEGKPWTALGQNVAPATTKHNEAEALKLQTEQAYRERDALMAGLEKAVKDSRDILLALNKANAKRLSEWGFNVDDTAQSTPTPKKP